jgi:hypothetical protein
MPVWTSGAAEDRRRNKHPEEPGPHRQKLVANAVLI